MAKRPTSSIGRDELLAAATSEFADHGYAGATTAGIARRAGVTQPLVHHHFGSKLGLWEAVLAASYGKLRDVLLAASGEVATADTRTRLSHLLRTFIRFAGTHPELSRLIQVESSAGGEAFDLLYTRWLLPLVRFLEEQVQRAVDDGFLREIDVRYAYFAIVGICTQPFGAAAVARRAFGFSSWTEQEIEAYADLAIDLLLHGMSAPRNARTRAPPTKSSRRPHR